MTRPVFTLIAGANGAGKSTLSSYGREALGHIPVLDPDLIATVIKSDTKGVSAIGAGREVLNAAATHMAKRRSFAIETTLAGQLYLNMMA